MIKVLAFFLAISDTTSILGMLCLIIAWHRECLGTPFRISTRDGYEASVLHVCICVCVCAHKCVLLEENGYYLRIFCLGKLFLAFAFG